MKRLLPVLIAFLSLAATAKEIWINVDFCDEIHQRWKTLKRGMIAEDVTNIVRNCRRAGADGIYLRVAPLGIVFHPSKVAWDIEGAVAKGQHSPSVAARRVEGGRVGYLSPLLIDCFRATMKSLPDSYGTFVAACRHEGLKISFWIDIHDEMFAKFTTEHPECLVRTPDGKTFPALRDYGNETAVKDKLAELEEYIRYRPDGFFFCTSCHTRHMRIDEPDEAFGLLPAAKFTDFLRRAKALMRPHGLTLTMGTACGGTLDFCSPYFANHPKYRIGHDWKTWVDEGIADALVVADYERFNRRCDDFWRAKGVVPDGVNDPAERFLPEFTGYVKGRVPLYYHIRLPGKTPRELKEALETDGATVLKFGLDGANLHELMIIENRKGGFDMLADMRRRFDAATAPARIPAIETAPHALDMLVKAGHIQGACCSEKGFYLSHQLGLERFDWKGRHLKHVDAFAHLGDVAYANGRIYGAFALRGEGRKKYGTKGLIVVWNEDLEQLAEKPVDDSLDGAVVLNDTLYVGIDHWGKIAHSNCCVRAYDLNLNMKWERTIDLGYPIFYGVQTMATDGKHIFLGNYGGISRVSADLREHHAFAPQRGVSVSQGFGLVPRFLSMREAPVFFAVRALGGDMHGWRKDPQGNPPRIQIRFLEYANDRFVDVTDYASGK